jgi:ABC-type Fe3+ transport system substrate-binding protein
MKMSASPSTISRRAALAGAAALASARTAAAAPGPNDEAQLYELAKAEGKIVWYEAAPLEAMQNVVARFETKYPGVKVQLLRTTGPQQYQRFLQETEAGQHIADMLLLSDQPLTRDLADKKMLASWRVPTFDRVPESYRIGDFAYAPYLTDIAIVYNSERVTEEEAKLLGSSWKSVIDPRFKNRFAIVKRKCGSCYAPIQMFLSPKMEKEYGMPFLRAVAAQRPRVYSDNPIALDRIIAGERDFVFWLWEAVALTKWQEGAPVRWVRPSPTPLFGNSWQAISANAPHPNAARLFQNWMMGEDGARALQLDYGSMTTLTGYPDQRAITKEPWWKPITEVYKVDWEKWEKNYETDMTAWQKIEDTARG